MGTADGQASETSSYRIDFGAEAFNRLPKHTKSVILNLGDCIRKSKTQLEFMHISYDEVAKRAPGAVGGIIDLLLSVVGGHGVECSRRSYEQELKEIDRAWSDTQRLEWHGARLQDYILNGQRHRPSRT